MNRHAWSLAGVALLFAGCQAPRPASPDAMTTPAFIRAVGFLQEQSRSPEPAVRANCIEALQTANDPRALQVIDQRLNDPAWVVRFAAAMAAGRRKALTVLPTLETLATADNNGSVRAASIYALNRMGRSKNMPALAQLLADPEPSTRANTAMVLGMLGEPSAIGLLDSRRDDPDIRVKFEITAAMARLGDEPSQQVIVGWALNRFAEDQWNAMMVCGDLPRSVASSPLLLGLEPAPAKLPADVGEEQVHMLTARRQLVAARSLAKLGNGAGARVAIDNLQNPEPGLRALALLALGDMLTPAQLPGIVGFLNDPDDGVKRAAAAAIIEVFGRMQPGALPHPPIASPAPSAPAP
jgi:HEAT repeat protein